MTSRSARAPAATWHCVRWLHFFLVHLQGDIVAILDSNGTAVVQYKYDAWGRQIGCDVEAGNSNATALSTLNPFRYRGYVYDEETGLYYLRSRYYNPIHCRFVNVDCLLNDGILNTNQQTYCVNNPVMLTDGSGRDWGTEDYNNLLPGCDFVNIGGCYQVNIPPEAVWSSVYSTPLLDGMWSSGWVYPSAEDIYSHCNGGTALPANASSTLHRPYVRKEVRYAVEANATRAANGNFLDANTGLEIVGKYHLGHVYHFEYWRLKRYAEEHNFTQKQFNDFCNNPDFYQIEDPLSNMSHTFECKEEYNGLPGMP